MDRELKDLKISNISVEEGKNPRKKFNDKRLEEMAESIKSHGILQPLTVQTDGVEYRLILGERRLRAAKIAGLNTVTCIVISAESNEDTGAQRLIENIVREDLNPMELALALSRLCATNLNISMTKIAQKLGMSKTRLSQCVRLALLPQEVHTYFRDEDEDGFILTQTHGEALFQFLKDGEPTASKNKAILIKLAKKAYKEKLSRRQLESLVAKVLSKPVKEEKVLPVRLRNAEAFVMNRFTPNDNVGVKFKEKGKDKFVIEIEANKDELVNTMVAIFGEKYEVEDTDYDEDIDSEDTIDNDNLDDNTDIEDTFDSDTDMVYEVRTKDGRILSAVEMDALYEAIEDGDARLILEQRKDGEDIFWQRFVWKDKEYVLKCGPRVNDDEDADDTGDAGTIENEDHEEYIYSTDLPELDYETVLAELETVEEPDISETAAEDGADEESAVCELPTEPEAVEEPAAGSTAGVIGLNDKDNDAHTELLSEEVVALGITSTEAPPTSVISAQSGFTGFPATSLPPTGSQHKVVDTAGNDDLALDPKEALDVLTVGAPEEQPMLRYSSQYGTALSVEKAQAFMADIKSGAAILYREEKIVGEDMMGRIYAKGNDRVYVQCHPDWMPETAERIREARRDLRRSMAL